MVSSAKLIDKKKYKQKNSYIDDRIKIENALTTESNLECPNYLDKEAKREWKRLVDLFNSLESDVLCDLDISALAMYCQATSIYKVLLKEYKELQKIKLNELDIEEIKRCVNLKTLNLERLTKDEATDKFIWLIWNSLNERKEKLQKQMNDQIKVVSDLSVKLCITPVGRAKMGLMKKVEEEDPLESLGF